MPDYVVAMIALSGAALALLIVLLILAFGHWSAKHYLPNQPPKLVKRDDGLWWEWWEWSELSKTAVKREQKFTEEGIELPWWWKK